MDAETHAGSSERDRTAQSRGAPRPQFDVFLSYSSKDKDAVEHIAMEIRNAGLLPWFDKWNLTAGQKWQQELTTGLVSCSTCAVFLGPSGLSEWVHEELSVALMRAAKERSFRVFLVLLPGTPTPFDASVLPPFLATRTWVDLREGTENSDDIGQLINAVRGAPLRPYSSSPAYASNSSNPPYQGLQTFDEDRSEFFFGRDADVQRLLEKLRVTSFLSILGPSGSGKSSVVRAGLVPALRTGMLPGSETWIIRVFRPGAEPLVSLAANVLHLFPQRSMQETLDQMVNDIRTLHLAVSLGLVDNPIIQRVVLIIDQFEEVFTLGNDEQQRSSFIANLLYAAAALGSRTTIVLSMRADFYLKCAAYPDLSSRVSAQQFLLGPMDANGLRQAIEEPARRTGLRLESGLVEMMLLDVQHQPGHLPLMEHALLELWEQRRDQTLTFEAYRASGGVAGALALRGEAIYHSFRVAQQRMLKRILMRLIQPGQGTEDTRRRATMKELVSNADRTSDVEAVVHALADARLLTTGIDDQNGCSTVEVSHEALIHAWPRLREWIEQDRNGLRVHRRLTEATEEWQRLDHDEGFLFRSGRLIETLEWADRCEDALNQLERDFLQSSIALREREFENERLLSETRQALKYREELFNLASSDLRNPIGAIVLAASLLKEYPPADDDRRAQLLDIILQSAERAGTFLRDLLDVRRLEAGRLELHIRTVAVADLFKNIAELMSPMAKEKNITLDVLVPEGLPPIQVDSERILQVLANLVGNAIQFTLDGGCVTIRAKQASTKVRLIVADSGLGITPEELPHLFERFWTGRKRKTSGAGLGLAVAKGIVEAHGETIGVSSRPGEGSEFYFTVPVVNTSN